jgi:hypothetical protein
MANSLVEAIEGYPMNIFLLREEDLHMTMRNLVMKILVSGVVFVTIFGGGRDDHGGGRHANHEDPHAGGDRDHHSCVCFDD